MYIFCVVCAPHQKWKKKERAEDEISTALESLQPRKIFWRYNFGIKCTDYVHIIGDLEV
jgi:hypothetical protein